MSSHITSDLEKIADYIVFIHKGKVIFEETKDNLIYNYGIMKCKLKEFNDIEKKDIIRYRKMDYGYEILIKNKKELEKKYPNVIMDNIKIEDVMLISPSVVIILFAIPLIMIVSSTIISDKKNKWTQFAITLPVTKKQIISSKYIAYLFWIVLGILVGSFVCYIILKVTNSTDEYINIFMVFSIIISL